MRSLFRVMPVVAGFLGVGLVAHAQTQAPPPPASEAPAAAPAAPPPAADQARRERADQDKDQGHVLARPSASPGNGASSAIGSQ